MSTALSDAKNPRNVNLDVLLADRSDLDLSNVSKIGSFLKEVAPVFVINASAYTAVDKTESEKDLAVEINFDALEEIAF